MSSEVISFIGVSYDQLNSMPIQQLQEKIAQNMQPYFHKVIGLSQDEKIKLREQVKETRKMKFRFSQEITKDITKDRIQIALSELAKLFRRLDEDIKSNQD